jgi:hypothetical protein
MSEYRFRRGWQGTTVLQKLVVYPCPNGGAKGVGGSLSEWMDVHYDKDAEFIIERKDKP